MGERLLVNGASGGVGLAAVQIGLATGAEVFAYARSADARAKLAELGAPAARLARRGERHRRRARAGRGAATWRRTSTRSRCSAASSWWETAPAIKFEMNLRS